MEGLLRNTMRILDGDSPAGPDTSHTLSIGCMPGGFVFSVLEDKARQYVALDAYATRAGECSETGLVLLEKAWQESPLRGNRYRSVHVMWYSPQLVLVPEELYAKDKERVLYTLAAGPAGPGHLIADPLTNLRGRGLYVLSEETVSLFDRLFPRYRLRHQGSVLIESGLAMQEPNGRDAGIVLHIQESHFELLLFERSRLVFYRSFQIACFDDLLYYLFYVFGQYGFEAGEMTAVIAGDLSAGSPEHETICSFFKKARFPETDRSFSCSTGFDAVQCHRYFPLLNLPLCE